MRVLQAVFRKEWTEARRDPRAWLLTLVIPVLFYPAATWIGGGKTGRGPVQVAVDDPWLSPQLAALPGIKIVAPAAPTVQARLEVVSKTPGFPATGMLVVAARDLRGAILTNQQLEQAVQQVSQHLASERAAGAGLTAADLHPIRTVHPPVAPGSGTPATLVAYLLMFVLITGCLATAVDSGAGERERGGMEALLATPAAPAAIATGKILFIMVAGFAAVASSLAGFAWAAAIAANPPARYAIEPNSLFAVGTLLIPCAGMIASWLLACSLGARSAREAHAWISGVFLLVSLGLLWTHFGAGANQPAAAWLPLLGAARALALALDGQTPLTTWLPPWLTTTAGWALGTAACTRLLRREQVLRAW